MKRCSKKEYCKQCKYVKFKGTITKWPVQTPTHRTTQKHVEHHDAFRHLEKKLFLCFSDFFKPNVSISYFESDALPTELTRSGAIC